MEKWLPAALEYVPRWIEFQMRHGEQPGCVIAIAHNGRMVLERAFGRVDIRRSVPLTPRHRFRVASHSKSFTAAGVMKLREQGRLRLDDEVGRWVDGLHPAIARTTIGQLLSHSAGIVRDGADSGHWLDRRPFLDAPALRAALAEAPVIDANSRFKYSNHAYGLVGLVIEAVTGEPYRSWIRRAVIEPAGLEATDPDMPVGARVPLARGHSGRLPLGHRVVIPGDGPTYALAPATGFVSTAGDLARFFAQLDPAARRSVLSVASRREMVRQQWRDPHTTMERYYGLGIASGRLSDWEWFGHSGAFQGFISRTAVFPDPGFVISIVTNAVDGPAYQWLDGVVHILRAFARHGAPDRTVRSWSGRWWSLWGAIDLLPMGRKVVIANPVLANPLMEASDITVTGRDRGRVSRATGAGHHGEQVRRVRRDGRLSALWLAGIELRPEAKVAAELAKRYDRRRRPMGR